MTLKKLLLTVAGALGVIGTFLPWWKISFLGISQSANPFQMEKAIYVILAILMMVVSVVAILLSALPEKTIKGIVKVKDIMKVTMIVGIVMAAITVVAYIAMKGDSSGLGSSSWGIWLMAVAGVGTIVLSVIKNDALEKVVTGTKPAEKKAEKKTEKK